MKKGFLLTVLCIGALAYSSAATDPAEARLSAIYLNGEKLEFFNKDTFSYIVNLPYTTESTPVITATCVDAEAHYTIKGNAITSTSSDGKHQEIYTLTFKILPKMDLFLAIGQSNMAGRAPYDDATAPMEGVWLLTPEGNMEISSNPMNKYSNIRKDLSLQGMGPHYQFALTLHDSVPAATIGMVVNALGGSSITSWYKPGKSLYDATVKRAKAALKWGEFKGIIWHQGESDRGSAAADNYVTYKNQIDTLVTSLRNDLGDETIWFITGELSQKPDQIPFNQNVIQTISQYIPYCDYASSEGCTLLSDNTHFDEASAKVLGARYAEKMFEHVYDPSKTPRAIKQVAVYLKNLPQPRIGSWTDEQIKADLESKNFVVVPLDCSTWPKTSPELEIALVEWHKKANKTLRLSYETDSIRFDFNNLYYIPEGYTFDRVAVWNILDHAADGTIEQIINTWNEEIVPVFDKDSAFVYTDMTDKSGNQLDYNMYMDIIHPSGTASKQVPLLVNHACDSPRQRFFYPDTSNPNAFRSIFSLGFLTTGYAWANMDHCYNPLARDDVYKYFSRYTLDDRNGLACYSACIRYLRGHLAQYNLDGHIGCMGIGKASYGVMRIANRNNATQGEYSLNGGKANAGQQPWQGFASTIEVAYAAAGDGTDRIAQYADDNTVPMITSAGAEDEYNQWDKYPSVVSHMNKTDHNHLSLWMENLNHTYPGWGTDLRTGESRYVLFKKFFDRYLKPQETDTLSILYILPKEGADDVDTRGNSRVLAPDAVLPVNMLDVPAYEPVTIRYLHNIDTSGLIDKVQLLDSLKQPVPGTWALGMQGTCLTFAPSRPLTVGSAYTVCSGKNLRTFRVTKTAEKDEPYLTVIIPVLEDGYTSVSGCTTVTNDDKLSIRYNQYEQHRIESYIKVALNRDGMSQDSLTGAELYLSSKEAVNNPVQILLYTADNNWSETELVSATRPACHSTLYDQVDFTGSEEWYKFDVSTPVKEWLKAGNDTITFCLRAAARTGRNEHAYFNSKDCGNDRLIPYLKLKMARPTEPAGLMYMEDRRPTAVKYMENGQLYILKNGVRYNILGIQH